MYDIYISYRRNGGDMVAGRLADRLKALGYRVFFDMENLSAGNFDRGIMTSLAPCKDVILVLPPHALDRCVLEEDLMRQELSIALRLYKNVIPVMLPGFEFPKELPADIQYVAKLQGIMFNVSYFDAVVDKIRSMLHSQPAQPPLEREEPAIVVPYDGEKPYIFASYSHRNSESVLEVIGKLRKAGYRVWYDEGIDPGSEWDDFIAEKIEKCGYFIAFLSEEYLESENCRDELNYARDLDKDRLLVYLTGVKLTGGLAMRLNRLQAIHKYKYSSTAAFFEKLISTPALDSFKN